MLFVFPCIPLLPPPPPLLPPPPPPPRRRCARNGEVTCPFTQIGNDTWPGEVVLPVLHLCSAAHLSNAFCYDALLTSFIPSLPSLILHLCSSLPLSFPPLTFHLCSLPLLPSLLPLSLFSFSPFIPSFLAPLIPFLLLPYISLPFSPFISLYLSPFISLFLSPFISLLSICLPPPLPIYLPLSISLLLLFPFLLPDFLSYSSWHPIAFLPSWRRLTPLFKAFTFPSAYFQGHSTSALVSKPI